MIRNFLLNSLREIEIINKIQYDLHDVLLSEAKKPEDTVALFFATKEFSRIVTHFLEIKKMFIKLDLFKDEIDRCNYFKASELDALALTIEDSSNLEQLITKDFLKSKHTLRLWGLDYHNLVALLIREMEELTERINKAPDNWYMKHEYMINDETFINKDNFFIYKVTNIDFINSFVTLIKCGRLQTTESLGIEAISINCTKIRESVEDEVFVGKELGKIHPDLFL